MRSGSSFKPIWTRFFVMMYLRMREYTCQYLYVHEDVIGKLQINLVQRIYVHIFCVIILKSKATTSHRQFRAVDHRDRVQDETAGRQDYRNCLLGL